MAYDRDLARRVREALAGRSPLREVAMFGGLSFMVDDRMVVSAGGNGDLLVRVDPEHHEALLASTGARGAEMGTGRTMGKGWITVDAAAVASDDDLLRWIEVALDYHRTKGAR